MDAAYRVRYQAIQGDGATAALVVEDPGGSLYLFSGGKLQLRFDQESWSRRVSNLLDRGSYAWLPVEGDARVPLGELPTYLASLPPSRVL